MIADNRNPPTAPARRDSEIGKLVFMGVVDISEPRLQEGRFRLFRLLPFLTTQATMAREEACPLSATPESIHEILAATPREASVAQQSSANLAKILNAAPAGDRPIEIQVAGETVSLPVGALELLGKILSALGLGKTITVLSSGAELTTQQAADLLNVSRPYLVKQLEKGAIPFHKVGTHRRILLRDVLEYKRGIDEKRLRAGFSRSRAGDLWDTHGIA